MLALQSKSLKTELYRKAIHLSSLWMPLLILSTNRNVCIILFSALLCINVIFEYAAFQKFPLIGSWFRRLFIKTLRTKEVDHTKFVASGSVYILAAALIVSVCFSAKAAAVAMAVMLISDSSAALIGKFFGTVRFANGKSVEGTLAFFLSSVCVLYCADISPFMIMLTALVSTAAEFFEKDIGIDDNFSIPIATAFILNLLSI